MCSVNVSVDQVKDLCGVPRCESRVQGDHAARSTTYRFGISLMHKVQSYSSGKEASAQAELSEVDPDAKCRWMGECSGRLLM